MRADSPVQTLADLRGRTVAHRRRRLAAGHAAAAVAAARRGPAPRRPDGDGDVAVRRFDIGVGLHGDHIGGERDAARALFGADPVDAACMIDSNLLLFAPRGRPAVRLGPGPRADGAVRPLHDDRGPVRRRHADQALRRAAARHGLRRPATCARCWTWKGSSSGCRRAWRATRNSSAPSTRPASTTPRAPSVRATTDLDGLGLDDGGHLLVDRALAALPPGDRLTVTGSHPALRVHLAAWCREHGHRLAADTETSAAGGNDGPVEIVKGTAGEQRWRDANRAGGGRRPAGRARRPALGPGRPRRARRSRRPAHRRRMDRTRARLGRHRPPAVRGRGRQPVGSRDGGRLDRRTRRCRTRSSAPSCSS